MFPPDTHSPDGMLNDIDVRVRLGTVAAFSLIVAASPSATGSVIGAGFGVACCIYAHTPGRMLLRRLIPLNIFTAALLLTLPFATPGAALLTVGPLSYSSEGLVQATHIALKANAIAIALTGLIGGVDPASLGQALQRLRMPAKLTHLLLFTARYLSVMHLEYARLRRAMSARAFRPAFGPHTLRGLGYLAGMLFVRAFDRSERIHAAMLCRGFNGRFPVAGPRPLTRADHLFGSLATLVLIGLAVGSWT